MGTVEQWWALYSHIIRLNDLPAHRDLHLFKKGIKPMWEDPANKKGGKWVSLCYIVINGYIYNGKTVLGDKGEKRAGWKSLGKPLYGDVRGTVYGNQSANFAL